MTIDTSDLLNSILGSLSRIDYIKPEEVPNIPLYMDQVTTFMDAQLASSKRYPEDKILTKTMINNYAKNDLLPDPLISVRPVEGQVTDLLGEINARTAKNERV